MIINNCFPVSARKASLSEKGLGKAGREGVRVADCNRICLLVGVRRRIFEDYEASLDLFWVISSHLTILSPESIYAFVARNVLPKAPIRLALSNTRTGASLMGAIAQT